MKNLLLAFLMIFSGLMAKAQEDKVSCEVVSGAGQSKQNIEGPKGQIVTSESGDGVKFSVSYLNDGLLHLWVEFNDPASVSTPVKYRSTGRDFVNAEIFTAGFAKHALINCRVVKN